MFTNFSPFPTLHTERLHLRPVTLEDAPEIFAHRTDPRMLRYLEIVPPTGLEQVEAFVEQIRGNVERGDSVFWGIALQVDRKLIGTICLWNLSVENGTAEIGYMLHPDFQGQGYMGEALVAVLHYGFTGVQAKTILGYSHPENSPSTRLLERNGFIRVGVEDGYQEFILYQHDYIR